MTDPDRQASILTPSQRRYLDPTKESNVEKDSHERAVRSRIRDRLRHGLHDFQLLLEGMEKEDRKQVFGPVEGSVEEGGLAWDDEVLENVRATFGFLYLGYYLPDSPIPDSMFRDTLEQGIKRGLEAEFTDKTVREVFVNLDIDLEDELLAEALDKLENGDPMTRNDVMRLMESGEFPKKSVIKSTEGNVED